MAIPQLSPEERQAALEKAKAARIKRCLLYTSYCVVKVPRFAFEKFQGTDDTLSTRMKAVGEVGYLVTGLKDCLLYTSRCV